MRNSAESLAFSSERVRDVRQQLDRLDAHLDKLSALAQALRLAAYGEAARDDGLYWPSLMATLEDMVPDCAPLRESIDQLLLTVSEGA